MSVNNLSLNQLLLNSLKCFKKIIIGLLKKICNYWEHIDDELQQKSTMYDYSKDISDMEVILKGFHGFNNNRQFVSRIYI